MLYQMIGRPHPFVLVEHETRSRAKERASASPAVFCRAGPSSCWTLSLPNMAQRDAVGGHHNESRLMKPFVILPALAVGALMLFSVDTDAGPTCPPDGDDSDWPTFEVVEKCGSYADCDTLMQNGQLQEAQACSRKIDNCGAALIKTNAKADSHNAALEACRSSIWQTVIKPADK